MSDGKRCIVFAHGNGFPAGTYARLFEAWRAAGYEVLAPRQFGHDPHFPVGDGWGRLRDELAHFIEQHAKAPVFLVGHSLGGLLCLKTASRRPGLARGVVVLDSPIFAGWRAQAVRLVKLTGLMQRISPGRVSRRRRREWPTREAVRQHFVSKSVFSTWDPRVLADYVQAGFVEREGRVRLAFEPEVETRIYDTLPHDLARTLRRHPLQCPMGFVAGTRSQEMRQGGVELARRLAGARFRWIEGTHLYPMESPEDTAALVLELLADMP
ncbi:alpha/beta fold hydrolase [Azohydromonas caseinilytica]|uniref:Alpha/beta hydrolase n=1 Tax=Azohydromonas caseinilytica TaxID=2728836 RepID=A0A848F7G8_9BURK|nr:alpha/beta hydrolase [Azohydromonas caseinilytica]NML14665.1 alpha/beta hydrolase [Azohydromonas caseinilytica]